MAFLYLHDNIKELVSGDKSEPISTGEKSIKGICLALDTLLLICVFIFFFNTVFVIFDKGWGESMTDAMRVLTGGAGARHMTVLSAPGHTADPYYTKNNPTYENAYAASIATNAAAKEGFAPGHDQPSFWGSTAAREQHAHQAAAAPAAVAAAAAPEGMYDPSVRMDRRDLTDEALLAST